MKEEDKTWFMKVYQNLPLNERKNTIIVLEDAKSENKVKNIL